MSAIFISGCAPRQEMYYWGDYSDTLYHSKKVPGAESLASHMTTLETIVTESNNRGLRIPPGVCAELGYLYAAQNNKKQAIELFTMERDIYPESTVLMERLILQSKKRLGDNGGTSSDAAKDHVNKQISQ